MSVWSEGLCIASCHSSSLARSLCHFGIFGCAVLLLLFTLLLTFEPPWSARLQKSSLLSSRHVHSEKWCSVPFDHWSARAQCHSTTGVPHACLCQQLHIFARGPACDLAHFLSRLGSLLQRQQRSKLQVQGSLASLCLCVFVLIVGWLSTPASPLSLHLSSTQFGNCQ